MSLDYAADCPLLAQDDIVQLHSSLQVKGAVLVDEVTAIQHVFHRSAETVLKELCHGTTVAQLYKSTAIQSVHITQILGLCNTIGALQIRRSLSSEARLVYKRWQSLLFGVVYASHARRYQANLPGISVGTLRACRTLIITSLVVGMLMDLVMENGLLAIAVTYTWSLCLFVGSVIAHEYGHILLITREGTRAIVLQRKSNFSLLHSLSANEANIALAGPFAGILFLVISWAGLSALGIAYVTQIIVCILLAHCLSLTPFYADGRSLPYYQHLLRRRSQ